jgi:glutamyl-tRNA synthetase
LGGLRTALFDWLYARHTGGQFILRIEDTDQKRYNPESVAAITTGLRWLGLEWDEGPDVGGPFGPYVQSERRAIYQHYANWLVEHGKAYRCYTSEAELEELRKQNLGYDRRHRNLTAEQRAAFEAEGRACVIRFAAPLQGLTIVHDVIRGDITVESASIQDPVLLKSDGMPTYHLAVVVDDYLMKITHILRGEEWIPSAPLHKELFDAFGWPSPEFVHLPVILDPSGKGKMSKRKTVIDGREFSPFVSDYIEGGYLPDAMFNFLATMGWNFDGEREVFSREEAIERFDVADISPKASALPFAKLDWLNGMYIRQMARRWAETYSYPMAAHDRDNLPQVAQFLAVNQDPVFARQELAESVRTEILRTCGPDLAPELHDATLDELISEVGRQRRIVDPNDPHRVLAGLPLPIYITTGLGNLLGDALVEAGKEPEVTLCPWNNEVELSPALYGPSAGYRPDTAHPLVYHLFGNLREPDSVVLTEDDYFDFLIGVTGNKDLIPPVVRRALADTALLFLGFRMDDWEFRVLFRSLMSQEGRSRRSRYAHVAVQIDPEEGQILKPAGARRYLESYFEDADISIYWGSSEDFVQELGRRWQEGGS